MATDQIDVLLLVVRVLNEMGIAYCVGGSFASSVHGVERSTRDIDLLVEILPKHVTAFVAALQEQFYADDAAIRRAVTARRSFNLIHLESGFKVDVFASKDRPFERRQILRRQQHDLPGRAVEGVYIASPEDTILAKLVWYRLGNEVSDQQWRDIVGVMKVQAGRLDLEYLSTSAKESSVADLLAEALEESGA